MSWLCSLAFASEWHEEPSEGSVPVHVGVEALATDHEVVVGLHGGFRWPVTERFGVLVAARITSHDRGYAESYLGPYVELGSLVLGLGLGLEANSEHTYGRAALVTEWQLKRLHASAVVEAGGTGYWYHLFADYRLVKPLSVGVFAQRGDGLGPLIDVQVGHLKLWTAVPLYNYEHRKHESGLGAMAGIDLHFF